MTKKRLLEKLTELPQWKDRDTRQRTVRDVRLSIHIPSSSHGSCA